MRAYRYMLSSAVVLAFVVLGGCGGGASGGSQSPVAPMPSRAPNSATQALAPGPSPTTVPLTPVGPYAGNIVLPAGSGSAVLTFSMSPPAGVPALTELTPQPAIAYITLTAQNAFSLTATPGFSITPTQGSANMEFYLNEYSGSSWQFMQYSWPSANFTSACFAAQSPPVSLQAGQSLYLGLSGDNVIPLPTASPGGFAACPQT